MNKLFLKQLGTNCLDNIFVNFIGNINYCTNVFEQKISDHKALEVSLDISEEPTQNTINYCRPITQKGLSVMCQLLENQSWDFIDVEGKCDEISNKFMQIIVNCMNHSPQLKKLCSETRK